MCSQRIIWPLRFTKISIGRLIWVTTTTDARSPFHPGKVAREGMSKAIEKSKISSRRLALPLGTVVLLVSSANKAGCSPMHLSLRAASSPVWVKIITSRSLPRLTTTIKPLTSLVVLRSSLRRSKTSLWQKMSKCRIWFTTGSASTRPRYRCWKIEATVGKRVTGHLLSQ